MRSAMIRFCNSKYCHYISVIQYFDEIFELSL